jgi:hypothetical protein
VCRKEEEKKKSKVEERVYIMTPLQSRQMPDPVVDDPEALYDPDDDFWYSDVSSAVSVPSLRLVKHFSKAVNGKIKTVES